MPQFPAHGIRRYMLPADSNIRSPSYSQGSGTVLVGNELGEAVTKHKGDGSTVRGQGGNDTMWRVLLCFLHLGQDLTYAVAQMELGNPLILLDLIAAGTGTGARPKPEDVKKFIETEADIEALMTDFLSAFATAPTTKFQMKKLGLLMEEAKK